MAQDSNLAPMRGRVTRIQLEITYRCNLMCSRCNRHCNLAFLPYLRDADMTLPQIEKFIRQVKDNNVHLEQIRVLGGEPLLHPRVEEFLFKLHAELMAAGKVDQIVIVTNGIIPSRERLGNLMTDPRTRHLFENEKIRFQTSRPGKEHAFRGVLIAPADMGLKWRECCVPRVCGSLLNTYGYWPNGNCAAIARLFYQPQYCRHTYPVIFEECWPDLENDLCRYCVKGNRVLLYNDSDTISRSYEQALDRWKNGFAGGFEHF